MNFEVRAEHTGVVDGETAELGGAGCSLEPAEDAAQLHRLPLQAQGPQRLQQPPRGPPQNH